MKRFRFPLRPVAMVRAHREMRAREELATAIHAYVETEEKLAVVRNRVAELESILFAHRRERFRPSDEAAFLQAYRHECQAEAEARQVVQTAREAMDHKRAAYIQAHRDVKIVSRLEERAREVHRIESLRAAQADLDDFAARRVAGGNSFLS